MKKHYDHSKFEKEIYQLWQDHNCFNPDEHKKDKSDNSYCIIMPPPNANDPLHIGHAMFVSIEDILIRYHRMLGDDALWLPGTDHAGIETQYVFEKKLKKKGKSRFNFDRDTLYDMIWDYVQENSDTAVNQIKKLGASADWSRFKFTLDEDIVENVLNTFFKLNEKKLIYRENRLVNYCVKCGTAFSNLEVNHQNQASKLYYIKYGPLEIATTRPETKFADIALAVNPSDKRYQKYIGQEIEIECVEKTMKLKVIADDFVDPEFGTGVVKVTPYHDFNDYDFYKKHQDELPRPQLAINYDGRMTEITGKYQGLKAHIARDQVVKDLDEKDLITKINKKYNNKIGICYRCKRPIEPLPIPQFYIKVKPLTEKVLTALDKGQCKVYGAGHDKVLRHWLENLEDWNISRQIVWGIRIPVWYDIKNEQNQDIRVTFLDKNGDIQEGKIGQILEKYDLDEVNQGLQNLRAPIGCPYQVQTDSPGKNYLQETDTFDTWFSSSQWPVVTLKNNKKGDFDKFYSTSVMNTGYDILPFWVMRMLMLGIFLTGKVPFKNVYLHGLVRDEKGVKMSKSKGNVINPLEITDKYGADALRMALVIRSTPGLDKAVGIQDFKAMRNLTNKIWNATRFIFMGQERENKTKLQKDNKVSEYNQKLHQVVTEITKNMENFRLGLAAETLYNEFWHWFCDECIEETKKGLIGENDLLRGLKTFLKLFHPFIPFVTEAIWQNLKDKKLLDEKEEDLLILNQWPQ